MRRVWVRYELPVMVLVELGVQHEDREAIRTLVACDEREDIGLARDHCAVTSSSRMPGQLAAACLEARWQ